MESRQKRIELGELFRTILGNSHVYFQPPETVKMEYPCIVYSLSDILTRHADNKPYSAKRQYQVTLITRDPDTSYPDVLADLPLTAFDRYYSSDNLNHYVYTMYY